MRWPATDKPEGAGRTRTIRRTATPSASPQLSLIQPCVCALAVCPLANACSGNDMIAPPKSKDWLGYATADQQAQRDSVRRLAAQQARCRVEGVPRMLKEAFAITAKEIELMLAAGFIHA